MHKKQTWRKEEGAVLVVAVFITLALVVVGSLASLLTNVELDIARNDRFGKEAFFIADSGIPITARAVRDIALNEGLNPSDYPGINFDTNLLNEVRNYFDGDTGLNDRTIDSPKNNPDVQTTVAGRDLNIDDDCRVRKIVHGVSVLFAMGYEGIGADRSHG